MPKFSELLKLKILKKYLPSTRDEASRCPDIVVAPMDCSQFLANQDCCFTSVSSVLINCLSMKHQFNHTDTHSGGNKES